MACSKSWGKWSHLKVFGSLIFETTSFQHPKRSGGWWRNRKPADRPAKMVFWRGKKGVITVLGQFTLGNGDSLSEWERHVQKHVYPAQNRSFMGSCYWVGKKQPSNMSPIPTQYLWCLNTRDTNFLTDAAQEVWRCWFFCLTVWFGFSFPAISTEESLQTTISRLCVWDPYTKWDIY